MAPRKTTKPKETPEEKVARKAVRKAEKKASDLAKATAMQALWKLINNPAVTPETIAVQAVATCGIDCKYIYRKGGKSELTGNTPLQLAIMARRLDVARVLVVSHAANVESQATHGWTSLHAASYDNNLELVRLLVEDGHYDLTKQEMGLYGSASPLQIAMDKRFMPIVDYLYSRCPLPSTLHYAIDTFYDFEMVKLLLSKGCDVNEECQGKTALSLCISNEIPGEEAVALILLLIESGAELRVPRTLSDTLLHFSSNSGWPRVTQLLIDLGLPINALDSKGRTPLAVAIDCHKWANASLLIDAGADVNVSWQGTTALHLACRSPICTPRAQVIMALLDHGANVNAVSDEGETPLTIITKDLHEYDRVGSGIAVALLQHGADPNIPSANFGETPLHRRISADVARLLIEKGANINAIDNAGNTPLLSALRRLCHRNDLSTNSDKKLIRFFIYYNADLTIVNNNGESAANHFAVLPAEVVKTLLDADRIMLDSMNQQNLTPLYQSLDEDVGDKILMFIEYGASFDSDTAINLARQRHHFNFNDNIVFKHLVDTGLEINGMASDSATEAPLLTAIDCRKQSAALYLLANGADYLSANGRGETPLHLAAMYGYLDIVKILVAQGAPINAVDKNCRTPLKFASLYPRGDVCQYLFENGGTH